MPNRINLMNKSKKTVKLEDLDEFRRSTVKMGGAKAFAKKAFQAKSSRQLAFQKSFTPHLKAICHYKVFGPSPKDKFQI